MRLSEFASVSSSKIEKGGSSSHSPGSRARKKHKRLDAICEDTYNRNRDSVEKESLDGNGDGIGGGGDADSEIRRSTRARRAPVLLDASPSPTRKRRKIDKNGGRLSGGRGKRNEDRVKSCSTPVEGEEGSGDDGEGEESGWKSRLRSRGRNVGVGGKEKTGSPRGKRKLFEDFDGVEEEIKLEKGEMGGDEEEFEGGKSTVVKSKRPGRIKASNVSWDEGKEIESNDVKEIDDDMNKVEVLGNDDEEDLLDLEGRVDGGNEGGTDNGNASQLVEKRESENPNGVQLEEGCIGNGNEETVEQISEFLEQLECTKEVQNHVDTVEIGGKPLEVENGMNANKPSQYSADKLGKSRIKEGRRCGLCGGATDGKPPKRLAYDMAESENDACSGSSASEEPNYDIWDGFGEESGWLGRLLGPIIDRFGIAGTWVHQHCAVWSPEVYFAGLGCLKNVRAALCRGRALKCSRCGRRGATIGCRVDRCPKTYHLPCARADGCIFDHRKFLIACTDHKHLFQPHGNQYLYRIKKMKAKKMKLEIRKMSNDAWRKDIEAEEKWLEGEDEEFLKRESKRLHRDILRIAPVYIGGSNSESGKAFQGWESVAGLQDVIRCMKEVVILPLLYPEFFTNLGITPPRGVLLHGYPGTGKTLVVRSLIGSCARGDKRIAYFARKGADCLGKYVGDAERQLRLLFQVAEKSQPSIIFFDEIDGLAPSRTRQQDQTHSSVVSTLLALMDGVKSRGSVVVIGATNRPDAVDPALRRPGRFDREIYFPLPSVKDRAAILSLHTQKWPKQVAGSLLNWIARNTVGFAGADLQALCTQAAIIGLKRNCPLQELLSVAGEKASDGHRAPLPAFAVEERDWLEALSCAPPPCSHREAGIAANDVTSSPLPAHLISCLLQPLSSLLVSLYLDERLWLPPPLSKAATLIKNVIVSALEKKNVPSDCWWTHVKNLLQEADVAKEIERKFSHAGILIRDSTFAGSDVLNNGIDDGSENFKSSRMHDGYRSSLLQNTSYASGKNSGLRILIAGGPRSGQNHLASCLLHCFVGNIEIQKVDLATISQEGRGDVLQGLTQILMKCSCLASCVIFMPRIDLWAIKTHHQVDKEESDNCSTYDETSGKESGSEDDQVLEMVDESCVTACDLVDNATPEDAVITADASSVSACDVVENATPEDVVMTASHAWSSFMEQVDSIYVSTSLMILATSEVPFQELPIEIRKFFNRDISKCTDSTPEYTVPRFSVQADGNFNQDVVIVSSAAKLSRDVVQQFVELIHHGTHHSTRSCAEYKTCNTFETDADVVCRGTGHASANHDEVVSKLSEDSLVKVPLPHNNRQLKGKSSLLLAISTFGTQILGYPHFAELCWVTSKLKDGPCSDINGPWKGWPFNTCVIRPNNSLEQVAVASGSSNVKNKEKSGVVRGLVAVGLSAYRGVYTSLREVSLEIRKVLKLLVENINAKIQAGKDKYQFVCILSQVAYLEDVVNSWAYTLQSLEQDAHLTLANPLTSTLRSPHDHNVCANKQVVCEECKLGVCNRSSHKLEMVEESPRKFAAENNKSVELKDGNGSLSCPSPNGRVAMPEEGSPQQMVLIHSDINTHLQNSSAVAAGLGVKILNEKNETDAESENTGNHMVENGFGSLKYSNGFALTESAAISEHGPFSSGEAVGLGISSSVKVCNQVNGFSLIETDFQNDGGHSISDAPVVSSEKITSLPVCLYSCCTECLYTLHGLMQKILLHEWGLHGICKTVEDVHDVVASLSMNLLSALRKDYVAESCRNSFDKKLSCENHGKLSEIQDIGTCQCESSENKLVMPMNCSCHSMSESCTDNVNTSPIPQLGLDTKFIYRDGVLAPVDLEKDVSFHCKFETLCLCSLIKWIAMTKKSLD